MNKNPIAIRILCYGDSNTWGDPPGNLLGNLPRYAANIRWTGFLQEKLGYNYEIIEEGLCGRTTILDDPKEEGRNGLTYLRPCLLSHNPLDLIILMLGTNDLKERFNLTAKEISKNIEKLINVIKEFGSDKNGHAPKVILISPVQVNEHANTPPEGMSRAEEESKQFTKFYRQVAQEHECEFIDITQHVNPSIIDGCHLEPDAHAKIAYTLYEVIKRYEYE